MPRQIVVIGSPGCGKCVDPGTLILTDEGWQTAGSLCPVWPEEDQTSSIKIGVHGLFGRQEASHFYNGGIKPRRRIRTRRGFELIGTSVHPVWAMRDGIPQWIKLGELESSDWVAIQAGCNVFSAEEPSLPDLDRVAPIGYKKPKDVKVPSVMSPDLAEWLGWFVSEGCNHPDGKGALGFCNYSPWVIQRMEELNGLLFGISFGWRKGCTTDFVLQSTRLKKWLRSIGVDGLSAEKRVPPTVLRSTETSQRSYLRAAFEAEGSVRQDVRAVEFSTASLEMGREVQLMLLNFGIVSSRHFKVIETPRWGRRVYTTLLISGNDVLQFSKEIGFYEGGKSGILSKWLYETEAWNLRGLPAAFVSKRYAGIRDQWRGHGLQKSRSFWKENHSVLRSFSGNRTDVPAQKLVARSIIARGLTLFEEVKDSADYQALQEEYLSGRIWDLIILNEDVGEGPVVDLTVPEGHSFIGSGIICHNTTAMTRFTDDWFKHGVDSREIAYLAFTKAAANEAAGRIIGEEGFDEEIAQRFPHFRTIHSLAYRGLVKEFPDMRLMTTADMKRFSQWSSLDGTFQFDKWEDLASVYQKLQGGGKTEWDDCLRAYTISRISCRNLEDVEKARIEISEKAKKSIGMVDAGAYITFVNKYETYKNDHGLVDFTDMLVHALTKMKPIEGVRHVVIDEAQDLSPICVALCDRLFENAETCFWAGDEDQCQPAGTMVTLIDDRKVAIEKLKVGDKVRSFNRDASYLTGRPAGHGSGGGVVSAISKRIYTGTLYEISAGGRRTLATDNHRFVIRWIKEARFGQVCVTYIMQRGKYFRTGWCQLFNVDGCLHLNRRGNIEKADRLWILGVHKDRTDASIHESVVAAKYGIPTMPFEPVNGANHITADSIQKVFDQIGDCSEKTAKCLKDHGRSLDLPFYVLGKASSRKKTTLMEVAACNLIPGLMAVPVDVGKELPEWDPITLSTKQVEGLEVYGLNIDRFHTYVADDIAVHNCIYLFSGADPRYFIDRYNKSDSQIHLRQTHRFGQEVWDKADKVIRKVAYRIPKTVFGLEGKKHDLSVSGQFEPFVDEALILHRHVAGCQEIASIYRNAGLPFRNERGDDPLSSGKGVDNFRTLNDLADGKTVPGIAATEFIREFVPSLMPDKSGRRLVALGAMKKLKNEAIPGEVTLYDLQNSKLLTSEGAEAIRMRYYNVFDRSEDFEYYRRVIENGYKLAGKNIPTITTMHGSKGRQSPKVVVFSEMSKKCWEDEDSEHRLAFVAMTRTQGTLQICAQQTVDWAKQNYDYPIKSAAKKEQDQDG